jgi:hypothetical protein
MSDGRDFLGRPVFSHGLGVGDPRQRALGAPINRGAVILHDMTPLPDVHSPQAGYGGAGILGPKDRDTDLASRGAKVIGYSDPLPLSPPSPMTGLTRHSRPGDPAVYGTDPQRESEPRFYRGAPQSRSGVGDSLADLRARDELKDRRIADLEQQVAKMQAQLSVKRPRKSTVARAKRTRNPKR